MKRPSKTNRTIRVYKKFSASFRRLPWVTLSGVWLEEAGFTPGDYIRIDIEQDKLTITRNPWIRDY